MRIVLIVSHTSRTTWASTATTGTPDLDEFGRAQNAPPGGATAFQRRSKSPRV